MTTAKIFEVRSDQNNIIMQNDLGNAVLRSIKTRHALYYNVTSKRVLANIVAAEKQ
jgi:hypothetical protein